MDYEFQPSKPKRFVKRGQRKRSSQCSTLNPRSFINETIIISDSDSDDLVNDSKVCNYFVNLIWGNKNLNMIWNFLIYAVLPP